MIAAQNCSKLDLVPKGCTWDQTPIPPVSGGSLYQTLAELALHVEGAGSHEAELWERLRYRFVSLRNRYREQQSWSSRDAAASMYQQWDAQLAYVLGYVPGYAHQVAEPLNAWFAELPDNRLRARLSKRQSTRILGVCTGPGTEFLGLHQALRAQNRSQRGRELRAECHFLDHPEADWGFGRYFVRGLISSGRGNDGLTIESHQAHGFDIFAQPVGAKLYKLVKDADLVCGANFFNEAMRSQNGSVDVAVQNIEKLFVKAPIGAVFYFTDLAYRESEGALCELEHRIRARKPSFCKARSEMRTSPYHEIDYRPLKKHFFSTDVEGCIPRKYLRYRFMLVVK